MKAKIKVTFQLEDQKYIPPTDIDKQIIKKMKSIGAEWYAQGFDHETLERDICFDLEVEEK